MNELVTITNLRKVYGSTEILKGIDLTIYPGEIFGFVGRNGAGKSTFIHTMTGIIHKSSGSFTMFGSTNEITNDVKSKIGVMPDVSNLYDHMKGLTFLRYMGELAGDKREKKEYERLLADVGLEGAGNKKIRSYSFGMKKKICIAQALLGNPQLIILDEPTSGVDPESAIQIRELILRLKAEGRTIFLTSHNLDEIDKISDRIGILSKGIIKKVGTPEELRLANNQTVELFIRSQPKLVKENILGLSERHQIPISFIGNQKKYCHLSVEKETDIPILAEKLIRDGISIYEIKIKEASLENIFMTV